MREYLTRDERFEIDRLRHRANARLIMAVVAVVIGMAVVWPMVADFLRANGVRGL